MATDSTPTPAPETLRQKLQAIAVRIPITPETVTAALILAQSIIALAGVLKVPLMVEKIVPVETEVLAPTPTPIEKVAEVLQIPIETKPAAPPLKIIVEQTKVINP